MAPARGSWKSSREEDSDEAQHPTILLGSSSDDEEANGDLSAWIVERARKRDDEKSAARKNLEDSEKREVVLIDVDSSEDVEIISEMSNGGKKKKKKKPKKKKRKGESGGDDGGAAGVHEIAQALRITNEEELVLRIKNEEELVLKHSAASEKNEEMPNNIVFRKLLRGPRYFEPGSAQLETCYNCGEEGHIAAACTAEKRKKPCFVCGMFGHNAYKCNQGQDCYICKRRGHLAKDCPEKHKTDHHQDKRICIRCGGFGHDMFSCKNDYPLEDLKKIQCYVCKEFGHFCCSMFVDTSPGKISCYNCGDSGHSGVGCAKPRGEASVDLAGKSCYICGEEGHFARGCTRRSSSSSSKYDKRWREESFASTPKSMDRGSATSSHSKKRKEFSNGFNRKTHFADNGRREIHVQRGGWIVDDDYEDFDRRPWSRPWNSPYTPRTPPSRKSFGHYNDRY